MRKLSVAPCLAPALFVAITPALADTITISGAQTTPVVTSTANAGAPADVSIASGGSITPPSGAAVTIDSNNAVTNAGTLSSTDVSGVVGILANAGVAGSITNSGTITVSETYTQTDTNADGVVDGPFAQGANRFGIETLGAFTGAVANSGTITIHGNSSGGIVLGGPLTGSLSQTGTIAVVGDSSVALRTGDVTGDVTLGGTITATGSGTSAAVIGGDVGGGLTVQGSLLATGYTATTLPTNTALLTAANLLQGGPALQIAGSVAGGVLVAAAGTSTNAAGTATTTTAGSISSISSSPALLIGNATRAIALGPVSIDTSGYGLEIAGSLSSSGIYDGYSAHTLVIGGLGGAVSVTGGASVAGTVTATAFDASAMAIELGAGAVVPTLAVSGTVTASGGVAAGSIATGLLIDAGASLPAITNSGTISAIASAGTGASAAIVDRSGTLLQITNTGHISATGADAGSNTAIDLSAGSANRTVTQLAPSSGDVVPSIVGDIRFGAGNDSLIASAGPITGNITFGTGTNSMALSGSAAFSGAADFGGGTNSLTLADTASFTGSIVNGGGLAVAVNAGTLNVTATGATALGSLTMGSGGTLGVTVNGTTGNSTLYQVQGAASFASGTLVALHFSNVTQVLGTYTFLTAGSLAGVPNLTVSPATLPYLYQASLAEGAAGTDVAVTVARKTASELGLNRSETTAYEPIYAAILNDVPVGNSFLALTDAASFNRSLRSLLPDHAGGAFDTVISASRATARFLADPDAAVAMAGKVGYWLQQVGWGERKSIGDTAGYKLIGWGASGGAEIGTAGFGRFGVSLAYSSGNNNDVGTSNSVSSDQYELAGYWRADHGGFHSFARISGARIEFSSTRLFNGEDGTTAVSRTSNGKWNGTMYSAAGGLSYRLALGRFSLRPQVAVDYYRLHEGAYAESGGAAMDLTVDARASDELAARGDLALGYKLYDDTANDGGYMTAELEGGRLERIGGTLGDTTARFAGGQDFTLVPEERTSGWEAALRLKGGGSGLQISGEAGGQQQQDHLAMTLRAGVQVAF